VPVSTENWREEKLIIQAAIVGTSVLVNLQQLIEECVN
jgi:hypothetical protein